MKHHFDGEGLMFTLTLSILVLMAFFTARVYGEYFGEVFNSAEVYVAQRAEKPITPKPEERIYKLGFVGDVMLGRGPESRIKNLGGGDYKFPFLLIAEDISKYDFLFGNLEGPMSDEGQDMGSAISFRFSEKAIAGLTYAGFDALSVANNHSGDWGRAAFEDTVLNLESFGIIPVGDSLEPRIVNIGDMKIAIFAFADFPGPSTRATEKNILESLDAAREDADIVVVSFHFGDEYKKEPNARQRHLAELAVDSGANLVIGHHPHVTQPVEEYNGGIIAYSLGNFVFDQYFSTETMRGELLEVEIIDKKISGYKLREFIINKDFQPYFVD